MKKLFVVLLCVAFVVSVGAQDKAAQNAPAKKDTTTTVKAAKECCAEHKCCGKCTSGKECMSTEKSAKTMGECCGMKTKKAEPTGKKSTESKDTKKS